MQFYDVRTRQHVDIPDENCEKVVFAKGTSKERYAFKGVTPAGNKVMKFCSKTDYDASTLKEGA
jgi:hypothetical protein